MNIGTHLTHMLVVLSKSRVLIRDVLYDFYFMYCNGITWL